MHCPRESIHTFQYGFHVAKIVFNCVVRNWIFQKKPIEFPAFEIDIFWILQKVDQHIIPILLNYWPHQRGECFVCIAIVSAMDVQTEKSFGNGAVVRALQKDTQMQHSESMHLIGYEWKKLHSRKSWNKIDQMQRLTQQVLIQRCHIIDPKKCGTFA